MRLSRRVRACCGVMVLLAGLVPSGAWGQSGGKLSRYLSSDFCAAVVIHPERIRQSTLAEAVKKGLPAEATAGDPVATALNSMKAQNKLPPGVDADKLIALLSGKAVNRVVLLVDPLPAEKIPSGGAVIVQFLGDVDGEGILAAVNPDWQPAEAEGVKYKKIKSPRPDAPDIAALVPDAQTLIVGAEVSVVKMLAKDQGSQPLLAQLRHTSLDNDIIVEFFAEPLLAKLGKAADAAAAGPGPSPMAVASQLKSASLRLNFSGKTLLHAEVAPAKPEMAAMLAGMATGMVAMGKAKFEENKKSMGAMLPPPAVETASKLGDEVFGSLKITCPDGKLIVDLPMPPSLPDALKLAAELGATMRAGGPGGPPGAAPGVPSPPSQ